MDNADFLAEMTCRIAEDVPMRLETGTVLCDPNGFPAGCPVDALDNFMDVFPRMDMILNLNASLFAMVNGCKESERESTRKGFRNWPTLANLLPRLYKKYWFVRNPSRGGNGQRFVTFCGHNHDSRGQRGFLDFFPLKSLQGQTILLDLRRVDPSQSDLFEGR